MKSSPTANGRFSPLGEAHARIQVEINARKEGAAGKEVKDAALETKDKAQAKPLAPPTPSTTTPRQPQANQGQPLRPRKSVHAPKYLLHGIGPGGEDIHAVWGRMRAVRQAEEKTAEQAMATSETATANKRAALRTAAEAIFKPKAQQKRDAAKNAEAKGEEKGIDEA